MIAVRLIDRETVEEALHEQGCKFDPEAKAPFDDHTVWVTAWGDRFFVPHVGPDFRTAEPVLKKLIEDLQRFGPDNKKAASDLEG